MSISELPELSNSFDKKSSSQIGAGKGMPFPAFLDVERLL